MVKWKKCPKCGGSIPENWNRHEKCGWNVEKEEVKKDEYVEGMDKAIKDSIELMREWSKKYPEESKQLDLTKIALTLFIQRRREKLLQIKTKQ
jgi:ribonuclease HI